MTKFHIQPHDVIVSDQDPFANDKLARKEVVQTLTETVGNIAGPCIIGVDAPWGAGKTTFLNIWSKYLKDQGFVVVQFNAWETDFSGEPFLALSSEIITQLEQTSNDTIKNAVRGLADAAGRVVLQHLPDLTRGVGGIVPLVGGPTGAMIGSVAKRVIESHQHSQHSIHLFREHLKDLAQGLSQKHCNRPLIIMIDELDRCRPGYAIELLETAKHVFNIEDVFFVLSTNRDQLAHSIAAVYGDRFDSHGYLQRFFDIDFQLPNVDRSEFIEHNLKVTGVDGLLELPLSRETLVKFLNQSSLNLRDIAKTIHRFGLVAASLGRGDGTVRYEHAAAVVLMILRTIDYHTFRDFARGAATDEQVVQNVFARLPRPTQLRGELSSLFYQVVVLLANQQVRGERMALNPAVTKVIEKNEADGVENASDLAGWLNGGVYDWFPFFSVDFKRLIRVIELFSNTRNET